MGDVYCARDLKLDRQSLGADVPQSRCDLIENGGSPGMRHFELQDGLAEIQDKGVVVGAVTRRVHVRFDRRDQRIETLTHLCLFSFETVELGPQFRKGLSELYVRHDLACL